MSKVEVNQISSQCGSTLTIGQSGDTVTLASGASQSGFGRTGTVDWQTSIKTTSFTAVSGEGYFCNTTSAAFTVTLPASPSAGDIISIKDYANTFDTNNLTLGRNSEKIGGVASDAILAEEGVAVTLIYADSTKGWLVTSSGLQSEAPEPLFVTATGGTITTSGDFKIHTFTGPGTFTVSAAGNAAGSNTVDYLVVAGGGGGGTYQSGVGFGGGGGAGGYRESSGAKSGGYTSSPLAACVSASPVSTQDYPITVGSGGSAASSGSNSSALSIISSGGGQGGGGIPSNPAGSGGGGGAPNGAGNTPPVSPVQGYPGGVGAGGPTGSPSRDGTGTQINPAAGESGPSCRGFFSGAGGSAGGTAGGLGGGGTGGSPSAFNGTAGTVNTGGGGGAGGFPGAPGTQPGSSGGSGIVIIRYKFQ